MGGCSIKVFSVSNIEHRQCKMCPGPAATFDPPHCAIRSFDCKSKLRLSSQPGFLQPQGPSCDTHLLYFPLEKTQRNLFEVCAEIEGHREGTSICGQIHEGKCKSNARALNMLTLCRLRSWASLILTKTSTALHRGSGGGKRKDFLQADPLNRETKL